MAIAAPGQLNLDEVPLWPCGPRSIDCFQKLEQIGQGTHGQVFKAKDIETGEIVAVKKIIMINEIHGLPRSAIREIKILQKLDHQNVIRLKEIVTSPGEEKDEQGSPVDGDKYKGSIYMVFDYMDHDLSGLLRTGIQFSIPQIKCYMRQLLTGLQYCHDNKVLHRDIKGSNLLIDNEGNLKLADFGLAKILSDELIIFITRNYETEILTNCVITLQYRPPELLLGSTKYGPEVDMWSVGCVFAELLLGKPIFPGEDEMDQLKKIFEICGTPDENNWPGVTQMLLYNNAMVQQRPMERCIGEVFQNFDHYALDLLDKILTLDPKKRISEKDALDAEYFSTDPLPCDPKSLPKYETSHIFQQRQQEEAARRQMLSHFPPHQPSDLPCSPRRSSPNQPIHGSRPPMAAGGPSHSYDEPARPSGGPNWYQQGGSDSHGSSYSRDPYPSQGCRPPSYAGNHMYIASNSGGYGDSGPNYPQGGQYESSGPY
ncbi:cyclin-dependent kinase C-2-like [Carex rostrata]